MPDETKNPEAAQEQGGQVEPFVRKRVFVFRERVENGIRPKLWAIPEDQIVEIETVYGREVDIGLDELIDLLGARVDAF